MMGWGSVSMSRVQPSATSGLRAANPSGMFSSALIGHTGFVGSSLACQAIFDEGYNSRSFRSMEGRHFSTLVCAGVSAVKWMANREPDADLAAIRDLAEVMARTQADEMVLVSTVDVYADSRGMREDDLPSADNHAYGRNRLWFEEFCRGHFPVCRILRLPGLYGDGLRKNIIHDMLNGRMMEGVNPLSRFQWYDVGRLWSDILVCRRHGLDLAHLAVEPLQTSAIVEHVFPGIQTGPAVPGAACYDLRTRHASLFGGSDDYIQSAQDSLACLKEWVVSQRLQAAV
jgi:hypothetical protein